MLQYKGKTFIEGLYETLNYLELSNIICVTGFLDQELRNLLSKTEVQFLHNPNHMDGMLSTLQVGIRHLKESSNPDAVLVCLTDQPLIAKEYYYSLLDKAISSSKNIICSAYQNTMGPPVVFKSKYYDAILALPGTASAKKIIKENIADLVSVDCEEAARDIDTDQDYEHLISGHE